MQVNQQQSEAWNGGEAVHYVDHADRYDRQLAPFTQALLECADVDPHHVVLDIGCGCGATTLAVAGRAGSAVGVDLSRPLVDVARARARALAIENVDFVIADAQTHGFAEGAHDVVVSQFGVMFFDDPVSAFVNLRRSLAAGGHMAFVCWQGLPANEWLMVLGRSVARRCALPDFGGQSRGPGMFSLCDPGETTALLRTSGFGQIECEPLAPTILLGGGGTVDDSLDFLLGMGMSRGLLGLAGPGGRDAVIREVRRELDERYEPDVGIRLSTGAWLVSARA